MLTARPFRSPHHTASDAALVGGGTIPRPGEVSLAHNGVLFLDELPEFRRHVLEALREPLEDRAVTVSRVRGTLRLPARFQLVAAMNPCPCGFRGDPRRGLLVHAHAGVGPTRARVSGPLLDRIDLHVGVASLTYAEMTAPRGSRRPSSARRVREARARQAARGQGPGVLNGDLDGLGRSARSRAPTRRERRLLGHGRGALRPDRRGPTTACCGSPARWPTWKESDAVAERHVAEALQFRHPAPIRSDGYLFQSIGEKG